MNRLLLLIPLLLIMPTMVYGQSLDSSNYKAGYQYGTNDWTQHNEDPNGHHFECPLSQTAPTSNFCKGYDAALAYQNSDQ